MPQPHTLQRIEKPNERTCFCYSVRRPFTASIWRQKKESQKYQTRKVIHKRLCECGYALKREWVLCPKCGRRTAKATFRNRMVWGNWHELKSKQVRSKKQAMKVAQRWYDGTPHAKEEKAKLAEAEAKRPEQVRFD